MPQVGGKPYMEIAVFDGGLNSQVPAENLPWNQSPGAFAVVFDNYGALKSPAGYKTHNTTRIGGLLGGLDGAFSYKPSTMSALLLGVTGGVYVATGAATAFTLISGSTNVFTLEFPVDIVQFTELAFFANGTQKPYKFNGIEFTAAGVSAPSQNITAVCDAAGGNLNGTYQYVFYGVNSYAAEGDYGSPSTAVTITSGKARINNIPTAPASAGVNYWKVARNTAGASGAFWYLTDVTNGVTSYTDNVADASLIVGAPTDQGYPRVFRIMASYANRLWGVTTDDSLLWFSNINQPEEFPSTNYVRVGRGDGMQISAIRPFNGTIVISKSDYAGKTAIYQLIIGDSVTFSNPESWNLVKFSDYGGSESHRGCVTYSNYLTMINRDGVYAFNGMSFAGVASQTQNGTFISEKISENITSDFGINNGGSGYRRPGVPAVNWKEKVWFGVKGPAIDTPATIFMFDYARISNSQRKGGAWSRHNGTVDPCNQFVIHDGNLYGTTTPGSADGYFYKLDTGDYFNSYSGAQIGGLLYLTPRMKGLNGHEPYFKDFRYIYVTCKGNGTLTVSTSNDEFDTTAESGAITLTGISNRYKINLGATKGKDVQIKFSMTFASGNNVTITRLEIFYNPRGLRS